MSKFRTPKNKRTTYIYHDANGKKLFELKPGENGITKADIERLHRYDDDEWNNDYKQHRKGRKGTPEAPVSLEAIDADGIWVGDSSLNPLQLIITSETVIERSKAVHEAIGKLPAMASDFCNLNYFNYLMEYSCLLTLCSKHKCTIGKIKNKYKDGNGKWCIPYDTKNGRKVCYFADYRESKNTKISSDRILNIALINKSVRTTFESRLTAKICELCGATDANHYEVHHVHKVKDLKGKALWEQAMIAKKRKTLVVCRSCHHKIHD